MEPPAASAVSESDDDDDDEDDEEDDEDVDDDVLLPHTPLSAAEEANYEMIKLQLIKYVNTKFIIF